MESFIFGGNSGVSSPEQLAKKRELVQAIMARNAASQPKNIWEGLNSAAESITGALKERRLDKAEAAGVESASSAYAPIIEALKSKQPVGNGMLMGALSNQWGNEGQRGIAESLLKNNMEADAPLTKWQQAQLDVDREKIAAGGGDFGLSMVYGVDANGNTVAFQANKAGGVRPVQFPDGVTPTPGYNYQDMGTFVQPFNSKTGVRGAPMQKDVAGAEQAKAEGKGVGEAVTALPTIENSANVMLNTIDDIDRDPYLPNMLGPVAGKYLPNVTSDAHRVQSKLDQLQGQTFLSAYDSLRGGGAITEVEGAKAERAKARLLTAQNERDFRDALKELRDVVVGAVNTARTKAQPQRQSDLPPALTGSGDPTAAARAGGSQNAFATDPQFGQEVNGYKIGQTAKNPQTGETIVWDGNGWRPQ